MLQLTHSNQYPCYRLAEFDKKFPSVVAIVHHYSINRSRFITNKSMIRIIMMIVITSRLPIRGAEHMCLLTPVTEELL